MAYCIDERFNQTVQKMLVKYAKEQKECWEDYMDCCLFAYNTSKYESSKFTLFEVMFGRIKFASLIHDKQLTMMTLM